MNENDSRTKISKMIAYCIVVKFIVILFEILPPISPLLTTSIRNAIKSKLHYKSAAQRTHFLVQYTVKYPFL